MFRENRAKILFLDSHAKIFQVCTYLDVTWQDLGKIYPVSICFLSRLSCFVSLCQRWGADLLGSRGGCRRSTRCRLSWTVPGPGDCSHWRTSLCQSCSSSRCSRTVLWSSCPCTVCTIFRSQNVYFKSLKSFSFFRLCGLWFVNYNCLEYVDLHIVPDLKIIRFLKKMFFWQLFFFSFLVEA